MNTTRMAALWAMMCTLLMVSGCYFQPSQGGARVAHQYKKKHVIGPFGEVRDTQYERTRWKDEQTTETVDLRDGFANCLTQWAALPPEMQTINGRQFNPVVACKFIVDDHVDPQQALALGYLVGYSGNNGMNGNPLSAWGGQPAWGVTVSPTGRTSVVTDDKQIGEVLKQLEEIRGSMATQDQIPDKAKLKAVLGALNKRMGTLEARLNKLSGEPEEAAVELPKAPPEYSAPAAEGGTP